MKIFGRVESWVFSSRFNCAAVTVFQTTESVEFRGRSFLFCYLSWNDIIHLIAYRFYYPPSSSFNPLMFFPKEWNTGERLGICSMVKFGGIRHEDMGST